MGVVSMKKRKDLSGIFFLAAALGLLLWGCRAMGVWQEGDFKASWSLSATALIKLPTMAAGVLLLAKLLRALLRLLKPQSHRGRTMLTLISSLIQYTTALVILCWGLSILGVNVSAIVASVGILALIVGFGAESLIADVVTGVFMLFENQCNVGDIVEVGGFRGTIQKIGVRTTCVVDGGDNVKIINNSEMKNILNRSDKASRAVCDISIPYSADIEALEAELPLLMEEIYSKNTALMRGQPNYLGIETLGDSGIVLRFTAPVAEEDIFRAQRLLNRELLLGLRKLGIECPFPQVDVHMQ